MKSYQEKIISLAQIYKEYTIYPQECYIPACAVQAIRTEYPFDHYSQEIACVY